VNLIRRVSIIIASLLVLSAPVASQPFPSTADACRRVTPLLDGSTIHGSTSGLPDRAHASCARQALSGERVYALHLDQAAHVSLRVAADYDVALYVRRDCGDEVSEFACNDDLEDTRHAGIDLELNAGTWFVFVDGFDSESSGNFTLSVNTWSTGPRIPRSPWGPAAANRAPSRPRS
jgi:hypothetical protein